ncbi:MAG: hypothetical protein E6Q24_07840 [Chitinophagaceae bacterium]|nr:MAG: hypothetical protein E6Q24_07840 [Chitinophagaceae bacterium]
MITYTTVDYSDIFSGEKPTIEQLLEGINSKIVIVLMAMINAELTDERDIEEVQKRLTLYLMRQLNSNDAEFIFRKLKEFESRVKGPISLWGKRYVLELMKKVFLNYKETDRIDNTPEETLRMFKAYLVVAEELNEKDRMELTTTTENMPDNDPFFFEKLVWPFVLAQFNTNERVNPISQLFRLLAFINHANTHEELLQSWKRFILKNGFESTRAYLGSVNFLINVAQRRFPEKKDLKVFSWITASELPKHLKNLAFDPKMFSADIRKQVDYLGMREKPLFETSENEFVTLDLDFLTNKVYNGPLFDMYNETDMATDTQFKSFADFKGYIATEVSEKIIFKGILKKLFDKRHIKIQFDDEGKDKIPDCYIRWGKRIFIIEFKDYLFPGKLVDKYSFNEIKDHIDLKFIKNEKGKNKGISQIVEQLKILSSDKFDFDKFSEKNVKVYPIIIHTNFAYQMPGINHYLNNEFRRLISEKLTDADLQIEDLVLFDLDILFEFLQIQGMDLNLLEDLLKRYYGILENRAKRFQQISSQNNFVRARASFDEIFITIMGQDLKDLPVPRRVSAFLDSIGISDEKLEAY